MKQQLRILYPTQYLGFMPFQETSFWMGAETRPDYYCCTSGSPDIGPDPLGNDISVSPYEWQKRNLELLLLASRKQGVPLLLGSSGDTGTNSRVDLFVSMIKHLALKNSLPPFKIVYFYSQIDKERIRDKLEQGLVINGLDGHPPLTVDDLDQTDRLVAVAGIELFLKALEMGADVIIGGRSHDEALFASAAIYEGFPESLASDLGRKLAHTSLNTEFCSETIIGRLTTTDVNVTTMHPQLYYNRGTPAAKHLLCEHNLSEHYSPGLNRDLIGFQNLSGSIRGTTQVNSAVHDKYRGGEMPGISRDFPEMFPQKKETCNKNIQIQLEGVGKIGERCIGVVHLRASASLAYLDTNVDAVQQQLSKYFSGKNYQLICNVYARQPLMSSQSQKNTLPALEEACIVIEGIAETEQMAEEITVLAARYLLALHQPDLNTLPPELNIVLPAPSAYRWTIRHILTVDDPVELFEMHELLVE